MEENSFIDSICEQLKKMTVEQKDAWILTKAKLLSESEQQDFIMSLSGEKIIAYMPTETEIETFCERVLNGDIYVEYESHYYEFNSEGRYVDDWYVHHNDPQDAFAFLNRVFRGCHDLVRLGEYHLAGKILDKVCRLEFQVVEAEDSEDLNDDYDSPFTIADAQKEGLLFRGAREIGYDWIAALLLGEENKDSLEFADKLADILNLELCESLQLSDFYGWLSEQLVNSMEKILEEKINKINMELEKFSDRNRYWREIYGLEKKNARYQHLLLDLRRNCKKENNQREKKTGSVLWACWEQICEQLKILSYERYIDDQLEIDEVWSICEALIRRDRFEEEEWKIRKTILENVVSYGYYDCYGCYDPIKMLADKLYITDKETLEFADILNKYEYSARDAANLYRQYGRRDKYVEYLENHLNKSPDEYVELIQCHCDDGNEEKARLVAEQGLEKCKEDLTEIFLFLLQNAKKNGETERYRKLYASAKRRKKVNLARIEEAL